MSERLFEYAPSVAVALEAGNKSAITAAIFCLESCHEEILRQKAELSLAEEGLANYAQENARLRAAMQGWTSYAWKDKIYVDSVQEYLDRVLAGMEPAEALKLESVPHPTGDPHTK